MHVNIAALHSVQLDTRKWLIFDLCAIRSPIQKWALDFNKKHLGGLLSAYENTHNHNP